MTRRYPQVASGERSFIAGGQDNATTADDSFASGNGNTVSEIEVMGKDPFTGRASGRDNSVHDWASFADGIGNINDAKIGGAFGNSNVNSSNDGIALGNRTWNGRRYYPNITTGSEDAGDELGVLQYFIIPDIEGDVTPFFPNALMSEEYITATYGEGCQKDSVGNIYAPGFIPATWNDDTLSTANNLTWALHRICMVRSEGEQQIAYLTIAKTVYTEGAGTKVYYYGAMPYGSLVGAASSYSPALIGGANSAHTMGLFCSTWGAAALATGHFTRAWWNYSRASGNKSHALEVCADASGNETVASGVNSQTANDRTKASGESSNAEGILTTASGAFSKAQNQETQALGQASFAINRYTIADFANSFATGFESRTYRENAQSYSSGKYQTIGDNQNTKIQYQREVEGIGWFDINLLANCEDGKAYHFETKVLGREVGGTGIFAYKFDGLFLVAGTTINTIGTPTRTLTARANLEGDGLDTGARMSYSGDYDSSSRCVLRFDGQADTTFFIQTYSTFQELKA